MFIAHLPAGYITTSIFIDKFVPREKVNLKLVWFFGLFASITPDLDLVYFYLFDSSVHHHKLFPHIPAFWLVFFVCFFLLARLRRSTTLYCIGLVSSINLLVHLILDTFVGYVWWLYPLVDKPFYLVEVPAVQSHWILNFLFHWTITLEIVILFIAGYLFRKNGLTN